MADQPPQPEQPESNQVDRRGFMRAAVGVIGGLAALALAAPMVATLVGPMYRRQPKRFTRLGSVDALPLNQPVNLSFQDESQDAYVRQAVLHDVWVIRHSSTEVTAFSPICTHLGCHYNWDSQAREFVCPCHGSVFSIDGKVLSGPAPRPLDTLPHRIEKGDLYVEWERFEVGTAQKVRL